MLYEDTFAQMLGTQLATQKRITGVDPSTLDDDEKMSYIRTMVLACTDELHEALAETGWKPWASSNHVHRESYVSELVDAFLFFQNLLLVAGVTPQEFYAQFNKTQAKVQTRLSRGYDGLQTKCPECKRDLNDAGVSCYPPDGICSERTFKL